MKPPDIDADAGFNDGGVYGLGIDCGEWTPLPIPIPIPLHMLYGGGNMGLLGVYSGTKHCGGSGISILGGVYGLGRVCGEWTPDPHTDRLISVLSLVTLPIPLYGGGNIGLLGVYSGTKHCGGSGMCLCVLVWM